MKNIWSVSDFIVGDHVSYNDGFVVDTGTVTRIEVCSNGFKLWAKWDSTNSEEYDSNGRNITAIYTKVIREDSALSTSEIEAKIKDLQDELTNRTVSNLTLTRKELEVLYVILRNISGCQSNSPRKHADTLHTKVCVALKGTNSPLDFSDLDDNHPLDRSSEIKFKDYVK